MVARWQVSAKAADIGYGVVITGKGQPGQAGAHGLSHREAGSCDQGLVGGNGKNGAKGTAGADIDWRLGIERFGSVTIDLRGGDGGNGGNGGDGQNVPDFNKCVASGGNAGNGGNGGNGGKGGTLRLHYTLAKGVDDLTNSAKVKIAGGRQGQAGEPGIAGIGTSGRYVHKKTLTGTRAWIAGGGDGTQGTAGNDGQAGQNGSLDLRLIANLAAAPEGSLALQSQPKADEPPQNEAPSEPLTQRIKALELLTQKLEARIRLLELENQ